MPPTQDSISIICRFVDSELCDYAPPFTSLPASFSSSFSFVLLRPAASTSSSFLSPLQGRHRLHRPPLNQVSDYLLEIDFTCSARFCICTSARVRRTSAIVPNITAVSPFGFVLSSSSAPSSSSSHPRLQPHCCSPSADGIDLQATGDFQSASNYLPYFFLVIFEETCVRVCLKMPLDVSFSLFRLFVRIEKLIKCN